MKNYSNEIVALEVQITEVRREGALLEEATNLKVKEVFDSYFNYFKEMEVKVSGETATFHFKDEDGMNREIFSLYFYSRYKMDPTLQISYYSTSTNNDFELNRLMLMGRTARVIKESAEQVLAEIKQVKESSKERLSELYSIQTGYHKQISEYRDAEFANRKVQIELGLRSEGVEFDCPREIKLKFNYVIYVKSLRIENVSKSGKTCTVVFKTRDGFETREENCNLQSVIDQVTLLHKSIVLDFELI